MVAPGLPSQSMTKKAEAKCGADKKGTEAKCGADKKPDPKASMEKKM